MKLHRASLRPRLRSIHMFGFVALAVSLVAALEISTRISSTAPVPQSGPSLVAHWKFDESSGTTANDSTGNGSAGTLNSATRRAGRVGTGALDFNPTNYVGVSASSALSSVANNFTFSFWVYPRATHEIDAEGYLWGGVSGQRYAIDALYHDPSVGAGAGVSVGTNGVSVYEHSANYMPAMLVWQGTLSGWTHVAVVYENKQPKLYINGTLVRTGLTSSMNSVRAKTWALGTGYYGAFDGKLDDVRVYGGALSTSDIATLVGNQPFSGSSVSIPGTIEAENFDDGAEGVAYHDADSVNTFINDVHGTPTGPPIYRDHPVDIGPGGGALSNGHAVGYTFAAEWLEYTVNVATSDAYKLQVRYASAVYGGTFHIEADGVDVTGPITFASTGSWGNYVVLSKSNVSLPAGQHVLRLVMDTGGSWGYLGTIDYLAFEREQTPYGGTPWPIPGTIEAENFDEGGEGTAYHDLTAGNAGGQYRTNTDVDIGGNTAGYNVAWAPTGEWLEYTANVTASTTYAIEVRISNGESIPGALHIEVDGNNVTGSMAVPVTGSYGNFQVISKPGVVVNAGQRVVRLVSEYPGICLVDWIKFVPPLPAAPSALNATVASTTQINLSWIDNSSNETEFKIERKTGAGGSYSQIATTAANATSYSNINLDSSTQYYYRVRATNSNGDSGYSNEASATTLNAAPTVSIISPANNATFANDSTINIAATASDDVAVSKVEFFQGETKLGEDTTGVDGYTFSWTNVFAGSYQLTAKATDNQGAITTSSVINVSVTLPVITITASDAAAAEPGSDTGTFTISRTGGTSADLAVNFSVTGAATSGNDYTAIGTSTTIPAGVASRTITITPVDDTNVESSETVIVTLANSSSYTVGTPPSATVNIADNDTQPPTVSLSAPANNATYANDSTINFAATASDSDGTVSKVEFFQGETKLGEDTTGVDGYTFSWTNVFAGSYPLRAKATDNQGATTYSSVVNVTVTLPVITITATDSAAAEAGTDTGTFTISRTGGTSAALAVNFSVAGGATSGSDFASIGTSTTIPAGAASRTITITPVDDTAVESPETVVVTLASSSSYTLGDPSTATVNIADNDYPPTVSLTAPAVGTVVTAPSSLTLMADATDADGIAKVAFYQNNNLLTEDTQAPYSFDWSNIAAGNYNLKAVATDNANATATSLIVSVIVNAPPAVSITSPANNATFTDSSVTITASASDADGSVTKVEFFRNGTPLGEDTSAPYSFAWSNAPEGSSTLTAVATDTYGATTTSAEVQIAFVNFNQARLDPINRTGGGGEDPLSRNFNWNLPLVSLPGRAGLDLGLSLSYNSLASWTKSGSHIAFDQEHGFPAPGFRLGFPVIQAPFYNPQIGKNTYVMITPSGARVELRQVGTGSLYQSVDSSYLLLDASTSTMTLKSPDGTQLSFEWQGSEFQCTKIKDRNGNFISVIYDAGRIDKIIDTLAREVKFIYTGNDLTSIKQTWSVNGGAAQTHTWATFTYTDLPIQTDFGTLIMIGVQNGNNVRVLTSVKLPDQSHFDFDYTAWGQVWKISSYGIADNLLNYRSYDLPLNNSSPLDDCPRFNQRRDWAANWNRNVSGVEQEAITSYAVPAADSWTLPDGTPQTGLRAQVTQPDGVYHKIYFAGTTGTSTGWQRGLAALVETYDGGNVRQRQSVTNWTQDDPNVAYLLNPRVTETNVYDPAGNRARTRVDYASFNLADGTTCNYPQDTYEYGADASTVLRRTRTEYKMEAPYTNNDRRILGLPSAKYLCDGTQGETACTDTSGASLLSKVTFQYDETGSIHGNDAPVQHDNTNYTAAFVAGRGNVSSVKRHDVVNIGQFTTNAVHYNTSGSVVKSTDAAGHFTQLTYSDAFAANGTGTLDSGLPLTLAYPTVVTDPDGFTASTRYNYQFGAPTWKQTPLPNEITNQPGPQQKIEYYPIGRLKKVINLVNNAYTRFEYGPNYVETWSTVNTVADEAHSLQVFDGHGRVIGKANNHPGSTGGFSGQLVIYDVMGRVIKQSNPTETNITITGAPIQPSSWPVIGDDYPGNAGVSPAPGYQPGWYVTTQTYDWKGRPLITTNTDLTTKSASYSGCGCAGGEVVTLTDEGTIDAGVAKRRQQRVYSDVLGRAWKAEILNWEGGSVYSTTVSVFNARDQVKVVNQYAGVAPTDASSTNEAASCPEGSCQKTTMAFDGHGRLQSKHVPEQNVSTATVYAYNLDDTILSVTDARGVTATYGYNSRHLVTSVTYPAAGNLPAGVPSAANVTFGYDAAGNRTSMTDGLGSQSYNYNQLSQITSETRTFTGVGPFTLSYDYNLAGQLRKITDPTNMTINYGFDSIGRLSSVTGSDNLFNAVSNYASSFQYRAWNAIKNLTYGNNVSQSLTYNTRLQTTRYEILNGRSQGTGEILTVRSDYQLYADGQVKFASDSLSNEYDRAYAFDHLGRLKDAYSATQARDFINGNNSGIADGPYRQNSGHDVWNNTTVMNNRFWSHSEGVGTTYVNNRNQNLNWGYDADGNEIRDPYRQKTYDAAGQLVTVTDTSVSVSGLTASITQSYDGDGETVKRVEQKTNNSVTTTYYLRSSVLDESVMEVDAAGQKTQGHVYAAGEVLAEQGPGVYWVHENPVTQGILTSSTAGDYVGQQEFDPLGAEVGFTDPYQQGETPDYETLHGGRGLYLNGGNPFDIKGGCARNGMPNSCSDSAEADYSFWGSRIAELPGFGSTWGSLSDLALWEYSGRVRDTIAAYNSRPRRGDPPTLSKGPQRRPRRVSTAKRPRRTRGTPQGEETKATTQSFDEHHQNLNLEQMLLRDSARFIAIVPLIERPECRNYVMGRKVSAQQAVKRFQDIVHAMTYDPVLFDFAEADEDLARVRLGPAFFDLSLATVSLIDLLEYTGGLDDTSAVLDATSQRAYILLHESRHVAARKKHSGRKELGKWYRDLYNNCFKPK